MCYLASDPNDIVFSSNMIACNGELRSPSFIRSLDKRLGGAVSMYEALHTDRDKEAIFEEIRTQPLCTKVHRFLGD